MLEARDLTVHLRERAVLSRVTLALAPGETLAVVGENGAGKSTLLRVLAGERGPRTRVTGQVLLAGRLLPAWTLSERARLRAVVPQRPEIAFAFTAREVAGLGRYHARGNPAQDRVIVDAALALCDATHLADREVTTLSGGEQARVHLASAFAQLWERECEHPRFVLLDEPTAALDLAHQHALLAAARGFARERGIGILAVLHDLNLAAAYADRVAILHRGRVLADGPPERVLLPANIAEGFGVAAQVIPHPLTRGLLIATAAR